MLDFSSQQVHEVSGTCAHTLKHNAYFWQSPISILTPGVDGASLLVREGNRSRSEHLEWRRSWRLVAVDSVFEIIGFK